MRAPMLFVAVAACLPAASAHAYNDPSQLIAPAGVVGAGLLGASADGVYFTGAPRYSGLDCASCHTGGPEHVSVGITADLAELFTSGYEPGRTYALTVALADEVEGLAYTGATCTDPPLTGDTTPYRQCNNNSFALEIDDASGPLRGTFCAASPTAGCPMPDAADEVLVTPDGDAVLANHPHVAATSRERARNGELAWKVYWTAPPAGTGPVTMYAAAVDGNGGSGTPARDQDPYGDDAAHTSIVVAERGVPLASGCAMSGGATTSGPGLVVAGLLVAIAARRRMGRVLRIVGLVAAGCNGSGELMAPGQDCQAAGCHVRGGGSKAFSLSGTIFSQPDAVADHGLLGATILVTDATQRTLRLKSNEAGNFYTEAKLTFPVEVSVQIGDTVRHMEPALTYGGCNRCHDVPPSESAGGRVFVAPVAVPAQ